MAAPDGDDSGPDPFDDGGPFEEADLSDALSSVPPSTESESAGNLDDRLGPAELRELVRRHQSRMRELPGIEELAYEWRSRQGATLLDRTESAYWLAVPARVWSEYAEDLDLDDRARDALRAVHERATGRRTDERRVDDEAVAAIVLDRRSGPEG